LHLIVFAAQKLINCRKIFAAISMLAQQPIHLQSRRSKRRRWLRVMCSNLRETQVLWKVVSGR